MRSECCSTNLQSQTRVTGHLRAGALGPDRCYPIGCRKHGFLSSQQRRMRLFWELVFWKHGMGGGNELTPPSEEEQGADRKRDAYEGWSVR